MSDHDVQGSCHQCGSRIFHVFYDPATQGAYVACECGEAIGGINLPGGVDIPRCDRCGQAAVLTDGKWKHAQAADGAFCAAVLTVTQGARS